MDYAVLYGVPDALAAVTYLPVSVVTKFLEKGELPLSLVIHYGGNEEVIESLLRNGASPNAHSSVECARWTPMHDAAYQNNVKILQLMVESYGGDIHARTIYGWHPIHTAAMGTAKDAIEFLVRMGASPSSVDSSGKTPSDIAREDYGRYRRPYGYKQERFKETADYLDGLKSG